MSQAGALSYRTSFCAEEACLRAVAMSPDSLAANMRICQGGRSRVLEPVSLLDRAPLPPLPASRDGLKCGTDFALGMLDAEVANRACPVTDRTDFRHSRSNSRPSSCLHHSVTGR